MCAWVFFSVSLLCAKNLTSGSLSKFAVAFFFATALSIATCKISAKKLFLNPGIVYVLYIYIYMKIYLCLFSLLCILVVSLSDQLMMVSFSLLLQLLSCLVDQTGCILALQWNKVAAIFEDCQLVSRFC